MPAERRERVREGDEVARDQARTLVDQLVERVLPVGAGLAPVDRAGVIRHDLAVERDTLAVALHRQLLEVGREALQVVLVRQHRHRLGTEEVGVPDRQQPHQHRQVLLERRRAEVLVHLVEAVEHRPEIVGADGDHRGQADRRVHRVPPAHPVPETEHVGRVDAERSHSPGVGRDGDEVLRHGLGVAAERREQPLARALCVGHRFERREGLRRHDEERLCRIEVTRGLDEVEAVDVRDEPERQRSVAVVTERLVSHHGPEVRAADADVDHVPDSSVRVARPRPAAHAVGKAGHLVEHAVHVWNDVLPVHQNRGAARRAKRNVKDGPVLGDVDPVATEHGVDPRRQP